MFTKSFVKMGRRHLSRNCRFYCSAKIKNVWTWELNWQNINQWYLWDALHWISMLYIWQHDILTWKSIPHYCWPLVTAWCGSPHKGASKAELWWFLYCCMNKLLNKWSGYWWFETLWCSCDVNKMNISTLKLFLYLKWIWPSSISNSRLPSLPTDVIYCQTSNIRRTLGICY